jgi:hypothetical protein
MRKKKSRYLATHHIGEQRKQNPVILRIILSEEHTQIDFGYAAPIIYVKGGWIRISPDTYLQVEGSAIRYRLQEVKNIVLAPDQMEFLSTQDWCVFTLFFDPIPIVDCVISMIEAENPTPDDFNYYGIKLSRVKEMELMASLEIG